jgi:hypothetical protein
MWTVAFGRSSSLPWPNITRIDNPGQGLSQRCPRHRLFFVKRRRTSRSELASNGLLTVGITNMETRQQPSEGPRMLADSPAHLEKPAWPGSALSPHKAALPTYGSEVSPFFPRGLQGPFVLTTGTHLVLHAAGPCWTSWALIGLPSRPGVPPAKH